jgi:hypothetical protein
MPLATREPLVVRTAAVGVITAIIHALVVLGYLPIDADQESAIAGIVDVLGTAIAVFWSRRAVTPVADPQVDPGALADVADAEAGDAEGYAPQHAAE